MKVIINAKQISEKLDELAAQIVESVSTLENLFIVGIHTGGVHLARRIQKIIEMRNGASVPCGTLDITLYRDDLFEGLSKPIVGATALPESVEGKEVVLVDDVLYTGRTVRSALIELMDYGRPKQIRLAVLVDRGHRELPIIADYVGSVIETSEDETVEVKLCEVQGVSSDAVVIVTRGQDDHGK